MKTQFKLSNGVTITLTTQGKGVVMQSSLWPQSTLLAGYNIQSATSHLFEIWEASGITWEENSMSSKIEIKIREHGDTRNWENIPVWDTWGAANDAIGELKSLLICQDVLASEIRWNYAGSLQGHYISRAEAMREYNEVG